jgi:hypothetical protein
MDADRITNITIRLDEIQPQDLAPVTGTWETITPGNAEGKNGHQVIVISTFNDRVMNNDRDSTIRCS